MMARIESRWPGIRMPLRMSGEEQFGLCGAARLRVQALPNADRCVGRTRAAVPGPRASQKASSAGSTSPLPPAAQRRAVAAAAAASRSPPPPPQQQQQQQQQQPDSQPQSQPRQKDYRAWENRSVEIFDDEQKRKLGVLMRIARDGGEGWYIHFDDGEWSAKIEKLDALASGGKLRVVHRVLPAPHLTTEEKVDGMSKSVEMWLTEMTTSRGISAVETQLIDIAERNAAQRRKHEAAAAAAAMAAAYPAGPRLRLVHGVDPANPSGAHMQQLYGGDPDYVDEWERGGHGKGEEVVSELLAYPRRRKRRKTLGDKMQERAATLPPVPAGLMDRTIVVLWGTNRYTLETRLGEV